MLVALMAIDSSGQSTYEPYNFTTLAGGAGFKTPDLPGNVGRFRTPNGVAADEAGNLYVSDVFNHAIRKVTPEGVVTTVAGLPGTPGSADGSGSEARFNTPAKVAVDAAGNLYVSDDQNSTIRKVTPDGVVTTIAGLAGHPGSADGTNSDARFNSPDGVAVDSARNLYIAEFGNSTIRKLTPDGTNWVVTTIAGRAGSIGSANGTNSAVRFNNPQGLAIDRAGNLYVGDSDNYTVRKVTPVGTNWVVTTIAGRAGSFGNSDGTNNAARFNGFAGVAVDAAGNVYVADTDNHTIRQVTPIGTDWVVSTLAGSAGNPGSADGTGNAARFDYPYGVAADGAGHLYVADENVNNTIRKMTLVGTNWVVTTLAGLGGNYGSTEGAGNVALFKGPAAVTVDSAGNAYVADQLNQTIRKVTPAGEVTTLAGLAGYGGSANGTNGAARFWAPSGVAPDSAANLYVADGNNSTIRKMSPIGTNWIVTTLAGLPGNYGGTDGTGSAARFGAPSGVALDGASNLYVCDVGNHTIRRVSPTGSVTTRAGLADTPGSADGIGNAARFNSPNGLAVDSATNIYVADTWNHTIRKITPARMVTTIAGQSATSGSADGIGSGARFNYPTGVAVDNSGNLYVADSYNNTVRKLAQIGTNWVVTTLGGMAGFYGTGDGTGNGARFANPNGVAVDRDGNIYVADYYFNTIRKGSPGLRIVSSGPAFGFREGHFGFGISAPASALLITETSSDLNIWQPILTNTFAAGLELTDSQSDSYGHRFYRLRVPARSGAQ
jgi:sugar lactone lactonase YvrE